MTTGSQSGAGAVVSRTVPAALVRAAAVVASLLAVASLSACGADGDDGQTVRVAAAASLTDVVDGLEGVLADADEPLVVEADIAGSVTLARQILDGSPVDVFLSADERTAARIVEAGLAAGDVVTFATNRLAVVVPAGNPADVGSLDAMGRDDLVVGRCAAEVPCGHLALAELEAAGIDDAADTEEPDVRSLLAKVAAAELDVALVYATDVAAADGDVEVVADDRLDQRTRYQAVRIEGGDVAATERFLSALRGTAGASLLAALGFGAP